MSPQSQILIGWSTQDVTPDRPATLQGQFHVRISNAVNDPVTVTALAIESPDSGAQAVMVSCDAVGIRADTLERVRERVGPAAAGLDVQAIFISGTHTHTAPTIPEGLYPPQGPEVITPTEYADFFVERAAAAVAEAWNARQPGGVSWAMGQAVVGHNRRWNRFDGSAQMYGDTNCPEFDCIEGYEDHSVDMLFTWDAQQQLTGALVNLACPSQETEGASFVSADFWHEVRVGLRQRYGEGLFVLPQCSAAGDQSPHLLVHKRGHTRMLERRGISSRQEIANRIVHAVEDVFDVAAGDIRTSAELRHEVRTIELPARKITKEEYEHAKAEVDRLSKAQPANDREASSVFVHLRRNNDVIARYEANPKTVPMELHVVRLGDVAFATNPFELFLDFGLRIKARSCAVQTFVVQLACDYCGYLPTAKAIAGRGYGGEAPSNKVGPEGGQALVEETLKSIASMWPSEQPK